MAIRSFATSVSWSVVWSQQYLSRPTATFGSARSTREWVELNHVGSPDSTKTTLGRRFAGQGSLRLGWRAVAAIFLGLLTLYHRLAARG